MTTINTADDLLRVVRENKEFREAMRRELLTEELLELPARFAEYAKANDARLDRIEGDIGVLKSDGDTLKSDVAVLKTDVKTLKSDVSTLKSDVSTLKSDVSTLKSDVAVLKTDVNTLKIDVDALRGDALEAKAPTHLCQMLSDALDIRRVQVIWMSRGPVNPISRQDAFARKVEEATDEGVITEEEEGRLNRTDMVVRSLRKSDGEPLWIAAEASGVINYDDIDRARQSATALTKLYAQDALPAVYGHRIADEQRTFAQAHDGLQEVHVFIESDNP